MMIRAMQLAELDDDELENRLIQYRQELFNLRFRLATSKLDNFSRIREVKKDIARVLTVMRQRGVQEYQVNQTVEWIADTQMSQEEAVSDQLIQDDQGDQGDLGIDENTGIG